MEQLNPLARCALAAGLLALVAPAARAQFLPGWEQSVGSASFGVALGDVDGDNDVDAWVTDFYSPDRLWLNDGSGVFTDSGQLLSTFLGSLPLLATLDGDTTLDLWLSRHLASNQVWFNDGTGTFSDSGQAVGGSVSRRGGALGDLDGDLDLDAFVPTDDSSFSNSIYWNDGAGTFTDSGQAVGTYFSRAVALGNVDNDTDLDVLIGNNGANKLWLNNGSGVFSDSGQTVGSGGTFGVALGDLDGDLDLDAFFANGAISGDPDAVWLNDGSGVFSDSGQSLGNDYSFSVVLLDCDGDLDVDAFVGTNAGLMDRLWLNDGNGVFSDSGQTLGVGAAISVAVADLDGDLDLDVFAANRYQPDQVWLSDGACHFTDSQQLLGSSEAVGVDLGDLDGDGDLDAVVGNVAGTVRVLLDDGSGAYVDSNQWLVNGFGNNNGSVVLADFDADLDLDLYVGVTGFSGAADYHDRVWLNDGSGHFSDSGQLLGAESSEALAVGDVDGDLDLDVFVAAAPTFFEPTGANHLWLNDSLGVFTVSPQSLGIGVTTAVALHRLDADGDLDLFLGNRGTGNEVWLNDGSGGFTNSGQSLGTGNTYAVALADLDGDLDDDVFVGNDGPNTVWLNDGTGQFTDSLQALGNSFTLAVHLLDVDGDDDLDAWATNGGAGPQSNKVWLNDGTGQFTDSGWVLGASASEDSALGDVDGDGDFDVFVANFDGDLRVWLNQLVDNLLFEDGFESGDTTAWSSTVP